MLALPSACSATARAAETGRLELETHVFGGVSQKVAVWNVVLVVCTASFTQQSDALVQPLALSGKSRNQNVIGGRGSRAEPLGL